MVPALTALARRGEAGAPFGFFYVPNGVAMNHRVNYWKPRRRRVFEFSPIL